MPPRSWSGATARTRSPDLAATTGSGRSAATTGSTAALAADVLLGEGGRDTLAGDGESDVLSSGAGDDVLTGAAGGDMFVFIANEGADVVEDFVVGRDEVVLVGHAAPALSLTGEGALVHFGGTEILLEGLHSSSLSMQDFLFLESLG